MSDLDQFLTVTAQLRRVTAERDALRAENERLTLAVVNNSRILPNVRKEVEASMKLAEDDYQTDIGILRKKVTRLRVALSEIDEILTGSLPITAQVKRIARAALEVTP